MKKCEECGKELKLLEGYRHLTLGKDFLLCSSCFDIVNESVEQWREFVAPYTSFFNNEFSNNGLRLNRKNIQNGFVRTKKNFEKALS
jgi:hypothetical protein